jgi:hypothetical protein
MGDQTLRTTPHCATCATLRHPILSKVEQALCATAPPAPPPIGGAGGGGAVQLVLADRVRRLAPHHRDPEPFQIDKSETEAELRRLARSNRNV